MRQSHRQRRRRNSKSESSGQRGKSGLALLSAIADAQGLLHASRIWNGQSVVWSELAKSALGYIVGFTIIGVGVLSGGFLQWHRIEQLIGAVVLAGLAFLLVRTAEA